MNAEKLAYIETFGCQMNERDSEIMIQLLNEASYSPTRELDRADVIVINTCSIRAKAEQKAYSLLGRLKRLKAGKPSLVIAVTGCVAQQEGKEIRARMPYVDLVLGPQSIYRLPELVRSVTEDRRPRIEIEQNPEFNIPSFFPDMARKSTFKRFVTIMQGCNNFCTYCVVPYTRGREISRSPEDVVAEVAHLAGLGVKEITLLGQNVNSYGRRGGRHGTPALTFPGLLRQVAGVRGVERIRFTTSHPKDLSEELMAVMAEIEKLCPHFHLPVQSGSNRVLKRMNRGYTIEDYLDKVEGLRSCRPDIAITTDIIVGFPGETEEDFAATMRVLEKVRYHGAFSFKYSDRPHTRSSLFSGKIPDEIKARRLTELQARQDEITLERNREFVGKTVSVMVEGESKNTRGQTCGRTGSNHIVNFSGGGLLEPGRIVKILIREACLHSLRGEYLD